MGSIANFAKVSASNFPVEFAVAAGFPQPAKDGRRRASPHRIH
jgi:hypothetical protein